MAWNPQWKISTRWSKSGKMFATKDEADQYGLDSEKGLPAVTDRRSVEIAVPVNSSYVDGVLKMA